MATAPIKSFAAVASGSSAPAQNGLGGASPVPSRDRQRLTAATAALVGNVARVQTTEGNVYQGTVLAASLVDDGIALTKATLVEGGLTEEKHVAEGTLDLVVRKDHIAQVFPLPTGAPVAAAAKGSAVPASSATKAGPAVAPSASAPSASAPSAAAPSAAAVSRSESAAHDAFTDQAISAARSAPQAHKLQRWDDGGSVTVSVDLNRESKTQGRWGSEQMLQTHDEFLKKSGKKSTFAEDLYTSTLDKYAPGFAENRQAADALAREMEKQGSREDSRLERSVENEEAQFSQVLSQSEAPRATISSREAHKKEFVDFSKNLKLASVSTSSSSSAAPHSPALIPTPTGAVPATASSSSAGAGAGAGAAGVESKPTTKLNANAKEFVPSTVRAPPAVSQPPYYPAPVHHHPVPVPHAVPPQPYGYPPPFPPNAQYGPPVYPYPPAQPQPPPMFMQHYPAGYGGYPPAPFQPRRQ